MTGHRAPSWRINIALALGLGFGVLMLLSAVAFGIAMFSGRANTVDLLRDRNERIIDRAVERVRSQLDPVREHVIGLRNRVDRGDIDLNDTNRLADYMTAVLDGLPQIDAVGLVREDMTATRVVRHLNGGTQVMQGGLYDYPGAEGRVAETRKMIERMRDAGLSSDQAVWGDLIWEPAIRQPLVNLRAPLLRDGKFLGATAAVFSINTLSRQLSADSIAGESMNFILVDRYSVLAHPSLVYEDYHLSVEKPMPNLEEINDPVLARIWSGRKDVASARAIVRDRGAHLAEAEGRLWMFVYRELPGYGSQPWLIGRYFPLEEVDNEVVRLQWAAAVGAVGLLLSILVAWRLGRAIGKPIRAMAEAADNLRSLEFNSAPLPRLRLRELDEAAQALNAAHQALNWFGNYVPRKLVNRLLREGEEAVKVSKQRDVTVLFTDIVGFTAMSENMSAQETADLLNEHFALMAACIEAEGGVIDKFIGDAVMAIWGALKRDEDQAAHACRAVAAIHTALIEDNAARRERGLPTLRVRCGLHTGPVVVGNIGAPGRLNYTVVGDTVNIAQRLEQLGRDHMADEDEILVLASGATVRAAMLEPEPPLVGMLAVKGRIGEVEVYRLNGRLKEPLGEAPECK
ncbi:adenylate/guanylate cyclase domain-containing protein [Ferrovibrio sp.]|uniref:adenylate/guanylate cyclase domain-containing protein n=1 Tax=Ferrovibrio sp. TaxID=1917215 RepID=UPI0025BB79CF|nr:adenylate/guanylate cyclase domain-containing protein [Ferrovibrio sp.]MBX3454231.1 adenylate/guanylate cyclase domain-containing protein [Ferrovibrio sp.]